MIIQDVFLLNYRNFKEQSVMLNPGINVLTGKNAQGKTNFLESIYLFSTGKSHRSNMDKELVMFGQEKSKVKMNFLNGDLLYHGEINLFEKGSKSIYFNGISVRRLADLPQYFKTVLFSPQELDIVKGAKEDRRRFLDSAICIFKPNYVNVLHNYQLCVKQKNKLLKLAETNKSLYSMLDIWNTRLCEYGARLILYRSSFLSALNTYAKENMLDLTSGKEVLELSYLPSVSADEGDDLKTIEIKFMEKISCLDRAERAKLQALAGPHRDDIGFFINDKDAKSFGSQGQQRSVILCLKMALVDMIYDRTGQYPVLLLDDILSELDKSRQSYLLSKIKGKQTIITCTNTTGMRKNKNTSYYTVENGVVIKK